MKSRDKKKNMIGRRREKQLAVTLKEKILFNPSALHFSQELLLDFLLVKLFSLFSSFLNSTLWQYSTKHTHTHTPSLVIQKPKIFSMTFSWIISGGKGIGGKWTSSNGNLADYIGLDGLDKGDLETNQND